MFSALAVSAGIAGFVVSAWVAYRNQVRRAKMAVRLLSAPDVWTVVPARRGSAHQSANEAEGDVVYMTGEFPGTVTNDGPRGGAIWGLRQEVDGTGGAWSVIPSKVLTQPYPLPGNACDGMSFPFMLCCAYESLRKGIEIFQQDREVEFRLTYMRLGGWGRAPQHKVTRITVRGGVLLDALRSGYVDLVECQVLAWLRPQVKETFAEFELDESQLSNLTGWALLRDKFELVIVEDSDPSGRRLMVDRNGSVDQGWWVMADRSKPTLEKIRARHCDLVTEVQRRRKEAAAQLGTSVSQGAA